MVPAMSAIGHRHHRLPTVLADGQLHHAGGVPQGIIHQVAHHPAELRLVAEDEDPVELTQAQRLRGTVRAHRPDGSHRSDAHLRRTASANCPGPLRDPLQRAPPPSQPTARPAGARLPCCGPFPGTDPAPTCPRRFHQRIRASRIEAQVRTSGRVLEPSRFNILTRAAGADHGEHLRHVRSRGRAGQGPGHLDVVDPVHRIGCQQVMAGRPAAE